MGVGVGTNTALASVAETLRNSQVGVSAQDLYWEREGAFTGEISAPMIKEAGAEYVRTTINETGMPGAELSENGWLHVSKTDNVRLLRAFTELLTGQGVVQQLRSLLP